MRRVPPPRTTATPAARRFVGAVVAVVLVVALGASACTDDASNVTLGEVRRADVTEVVDASATVTAKAVATLSAPTDGTLSAVSVTSGQSVTTGQVLAVVSSPAAQDRLAQAESALNALRGGGGAGYTGGDLVAVQRRTDQAANVTFARAREDAGKIVEPELRAALLSQVDAAERAYQEAAATSRALIASVQRGLAGVGQAMTALTAAQRAQAQAAYDAAKATVDALTLRAPIPGVVQLGGVGSGQGAPSLTDLLGAAGAAGGVPAPGAGAGGGGGAGVAGDSPSGPGIDTSLAPGTPVRGGTPVVTIVDVSELGLVAEVDETDVLLVSPGVTAEVELDAAPGARYRATVRSVDVLPTTSARGGVSYRVRLTLTAGRYPDGREAPGPRPGMSAVTHLAVRSATDAIAVPAAAVFNAGGHDAVWVVRDGKAVRIPVTVGVSGQDLVQVVSGLNGGDRIVVRGTDQVRPGQPLP